MKNCLVIKCGFSLLNESEEAESFSWEVNSSIHGEASKMEVIINQQEETSTMSNNNNIHGVLASRIIDNEEALRSQQGETRSMGNNNKDTNGALMLLQATIAKLSDGDESQINQQEDTISIGDISMVSQDDSEESDESEINEQEETKLVYPQKIKGLAVCRNVVES